MNVARVKLSLGHEHPNGPRLDTGGKSATLSALCDAGLVCWRKPEDRERTIGSFQHRRHDGHLQPRPPRDAGRGGFGSGKIARPILRLNVHGLSTKSTPLELTRRATCLKLGMKLQAQWTTKAY